MVALLIMTDSFIELLHLWKNPFRNFYVNRYVTDWLLISDKTRHVTNGGSGGVVRSHNICIYILTHVLLFINNVLERDQICPIDFTTVG